jgi:hypothetical protein
LEEGHDFVDGGGLGLLGDGGCGKEADGIGTYEMNGGSIGSDV